MFRKIGYLGYLLTHSLTHTLVPRNIILVHDKFLEAAQFSFNYNTLLLVASILAGLGLVSNSSATIIASMLVSPIMGPVVGLAYGTTIKDWQLVRLSLRNECLSLLFCIIVGMTIAAITGPTQLSNTWPTSEMSSRGQMSTFLVGLPIAFFSGLGVAVSLLDDQTNSLVGVAISASLLPPAVNAGIMWVGYAFVQSDSGFIPNQYASLEDVYPTLYNITLVLGAINAQDNYVDRVNYRRMGGLSLGLTFANIILIWISGMLMFRMKEVLPVKKAVFWDDLGLARKIYSRKAIMQVMEQPGSLQSGAEQQA